MRSFVFSAFALSACANSTAPEPTNTSQIAKEFVEACMGEWVHVPPASGDNAGPFRVKVRPDGQFEAELGGKKLIGAWEAFGTLDAGVRMTDGSSGEVLEIVECPGDKPTVVLGTDDYPVRRPS